MFAPTPDRATTMPYQGVPTASAPKEIGVMQRLDGIRSGVTELEYQLRAFIAALQGGPTEAGACNGRPCQSGITGALSDTEASIRESMGLLKQLTDAF